ncbi:MAG: UbiA family prenyltransferase [Flavobacteriales bacterium]|nr:UbiA family prenyltransferase [Flavobacteriales bacterium]
MQKLIGFLKLIRYFHALLGLLPFIALFLVIEHQMGENSIDCELNALHFIAVCIGVELLMMTGMALNDIVDRDIDKINKPDTHIVGRVISLKGSRQIFTILTILAVLVSVYIVCFVFIEWAYISIGVYLLSLAYNFYLKRSPLFGNVTMAFLAALIPLTIMFFARECLDALGDERVYVLILFYAILPFLIIIPRELSLDISDMEGDKACGAKTLPVLIGANRTKGIVIAMLTVTLLLSFVVIYKFRYLMGTLLVVDLLITVYIYKLISVQSRIDYIRIGRFLWFTMILGLIGATSVTLGLV